MTLPDPRPGLVVHYNYLWRREHAAGLDQSPYSRPCAIIVAVARGDALEVVLAPITHTPPLDRLAAVELPSRVKAHLGLDDARSWVITDDLNHGPWPGPDVEPVPRGPNAGEAAYGVLPPKLFEQIKAQILAHPPTPTPRAS